MNPLSAMSPFPAAGIRPMALPKADAEALAPAPIPLAELEALQPSVLRGPSQAAPAGTPSFGSMLGRMVNEVNTQQVAAGEAVNGLLSGQNIPLHQAMIAMEEAGLSFQLMVEVRNKLLESYQELMRMQI